MNILSLAHRFFHLEKLLQSSLIALLLLPALPSFAAEKVFVKTVEVNSDVRFSIDSHRGQVVITTGNVDTVSITAVIRHDDAEVIDDVEIEVRSSPQRVSVGIDFDQNIFSFTSLFNLNSFEYPDIRFEIVLPEQASLTIDSHRSILDIQAPRGRINISSHRGEGFISNIRNDINLDTHRGDFELVIEDLHDVQIDSHRGNIQLNIASAINFSIDANTHRGDFTVQGLDVPIRKDERSRYIDFTQGSGINRIEIDTHRGSIDFNFHD